MLVSFYRIKRSTFAVRAGSFLEVRDDEARHALHKVISAVLVCIFITFSPGLWSLGSNYCIGYGCQMARESILVAGQPVNGTRVMSLSQGMACLSFSTGEKDTGGFIANIDFSMPPTLTMSVGDDYTPQYGAMFSIGAGYSFLWPLGKMLRLSLAPQVSWITVGGEVLEKGKSIYDSWGIDGSAFGVGTSAEIDWYPFDSGWGIIDGLHAFVLAQAFVDLPDFPRGRLGAIAGLGLYLD